ncbi:MAG: glycosyltransferase [bacterium]|nr:glycosyltransferase [bacterium]
MKFFLGCVISFIVAFLFSKHFATFKGVEDLPGSGPQKVNPENASRMGGVAIILALILSALVAGFKDLILLILTSLPVFFVAIYEDAFQKVRPSIRLIIAFFSALIFSIVFDIYITHVDIPLFDAILSNPLFGLMFTMFAVAGITNSFNIIDGLHGLASGVGIVVFAFYALTSYLVGDMFVFGISALTLFALLGFFIRNYPSGKILLGDNGAYFLGFLIATTSVLLVYRNDGISPWFPLLSVAYPFTETVFSIYRRRFAKRKNAMDADILHMHSLVFKRYIRNNAKTSPLFWAGTFITCLIALFLRSNTRALIGLYVVYLVVYVISYLRIVRFRNKRVIFSGSREKTL